MPIFQDPERQRFYDLWSDDHHHRHHHHHHQHGDQERGEESRNPASSWDVFGHADYGCGVSTSDVTSLGDLRTPGPHRSKVQPSDRGEWIQYLKNDASAWMHNQLVCFNPLHIHFAPANGSSRTIQMPTIPQTRVIRHTIIHGWMKGPTSRRIPGTNSRRMICRNWLRQPI